ncbi:chemotaxis protein [Microvirga tunisiensis]|uniref:Chemotaxis protein n=1 Tax=Pannonibacter tanglangensis TaxID=2750084 RepID=A0A7X5F437_9HYPH|nr:chemotaxis protein [Pannonibacter sp. XCT-53]NBN79371.1 chemotaxis protein [Pannonibacter sp. XCT-53]
MTRRMTRRRTWCSASALLLAGSLWSGAGVTAPERAAPDNTPVNALAETPAGGPLGGEPLPGAVPLPAVPSGPVPVPAVPVSGIQPFELVRTLQALQGEVAQGDARAHVAQRALLGRMQDAFLSAPPETWADQRNARAAVIYLLSGGNPKVVRQLIALTPPPAVEDDLLRGALAYVDGNAEEARRRLSRFDPMDLPPNLGGQVALVRAALEVAGQPQEALRLLGIARLLMPGTLVEEAALRREVFLAGKLGEIDRFQSLSIRYLRRFKGSIYAGDFQRRFGMALDGLGFGLDQRRFVLLEGLLAEFEVPVRRQYYMAVTRQAVVSGNLEIARMAAGRTRPLVAEGSPDEVRLRLYTAASSLAPADVMATRELLWSIDRKTLAPEDLALMDAVYAVLNHVRHWPSPPDGVIGDIGAYASIDAPADPDWRRPVMREAEFVLRETGEMLDQAREGGRNGG